MDFTVEEQDRINQLYGTDFADIKPDDAELIGRWEAYKAQQDEEHQARLETIAKESEARLEQSMEAARAAMENLSNLADLARARLERLSHE